MHVLNLNDFEDKGERKKALMIASSSIVVFLILTYFITFHIKPAIPVDLPPLNSDEVVEEFMIDNVELTSEDGGGGGGTPSDAPIDEPKEQTREYLTTNDSPFEVNSGKSQNQNSDSSKNKTSTSTQAKNYFNTSGGTGGKEGAGKGKFGGIGNGGNGEDGPGTGEGGGTRVRMNDPVLPQYKTEFDSKVYLQLTINGNGEVVNAKCIKSKSTCSDPSIINDVIRQVIKQVKYKKDPNTALAITYITLNIDAQ